MKIDTLPPQQIEAEQQLLGAILLDPDTLLVAADIITATDFYRKSHAEIFNACLDEYQLNGGLDIISLHERLKINGTLELVGGLSYLSRLAVITPTTALVKRHAELIKEKSILRQVRNWTYTVQKRIDEDPPDSLPSFFGELQKEISALSDTVEEKRNPDIATIIASVHRRWRAVKANDKNAYIPLDAKLSHAIPYFCPGHLWAIGGYTSVGKSTFLAQLIIDSCEYGAKVLGFSLEDSQEDKTIKLLANLCDCTQKQLMLGNTENIIALQEAEQQLRDWNLIIYDSIYTVDEMLLKIKKHKLQTGTNLVWIDYIQNVQGQGDHYERLSSAIVKLQKAAKEHEVTIIVLSQVTNESMKANTEVIGLKGAGELAAAPDIIIWLKRHKGEGKERFIDAEIRKNRPFGETGIAQLMFSQNWSRIVRR